MKIKILDCTLRDGGYVNGWDFGSKNSKIIASNLCDAGIDYVEVGFLKNEFQGENKTIYNDISQINGIPPSVCNTKITAMIVFGKFDIQNIIEKTNEIKLDAIRVTFKKQELQDVKEYLMKIKNCGYELFVNPTNIENYSDIELLKIIEMVNEIKPKGFAIVDTNGVLRQKDLLRLYYLINNNLDNSIALCFHSHNNLQLSFPNAMALIEVCKNRELIIDSSVFGMGRGAGNLCTELITQYINDNYNGKYDIVPILKIIDECINPIFMRTPWGYSVPYYLAATNHCHPNYAKYLADKQTIPVEMINSLLASIPATKKSYYDEALIKQIYIDKLSAQIDDSKATKWLSEQIKDRKILVLAPGRSIASQKELVDEYIKRNNPFVVSLNFEPSDYKVDMVFVSNMKRFLSFDDIKAPVIITSNINCDLSNPKAQNIMALSYSKYLNSSAMYDNVALMFFKVLLSMEVSEVAVAGLDGFSNVASENYYKPEMINSGRIGDIDERNNIMQAELNKLGEDIKIEFVTESRYK